LTAQYASRLRPDYCALQPHAREEIAANRPPSRRKTFIVTGGTAGLGLATARALIAEGANVLVTGRTEEKFHRARRESLTDGAHRIAYLAGDNALLPGMFATERMEHLFKDKAPDLSPVSPAQARPARKVCRCEPRHVAVSAEPAPATSTSKLSVYTGRAVRELRANQSFAIIRSHRGQT
jgi:hypothetical protein